MSAECSSCGKTMRTPEPIWYSGTRYNWNVWWACGACVDGIPVTQRHPSTTLMEFEVTFGPLHADTNGQGIYQGMTSKQGDPQFWVRNDDLTTFVPGGQKFVDRFYPFNDMTDYLPWIAKGVRAGEVPAGGDHKKLLRDLTLLGPAIERFLYGSRQLKRASYLPYNLGTLTDEQRVLAEELLAEILKRY